MTRGMLFALCALLCVAFTLTACGGDTSSPENVTKAFHEALKAKDKERMKKLLSKEDMKNWKDDQEVKADKDQEGAFEVGSATITGETATVPVTYTDKDGKKSEKPTKWHCVREDGEWKVAMGVTFTEALKEAFGGG